MNSQSKQTGWKRTVLKQILFVWAYWAGILMVLWLWNRFLFPLFGEGNVYKTMIEPWLEEILASTIPMTWCGIAIGFTPFLVGAVWCRDNQFYLMMTRASLLVKIMWGTFVIQSALIAVNCCFDSSDGRSIFICSRIFAVLIPFFLWVLFYILHSKATAHFARRRKESRLEWSTRIGLDAVRGIAYAQLPICSASLAGLGLLAFTLI